MSRHIFEVKDHTQLEKCFPVLKELRPHLTIENYFTIYESAKKEDCTLVAMEENDQIIAPNRIQSHSRFHPWKASLYRRSCFK